MNILEVSKMFSLSEHTLRYYEKEGLLNHIERINGIRNFTDNDLKRLEFIVCMRSAGVSIASLKDYLSSLDQGEATFNYRKEILIKERDLMKDKIEKMQVALDKLEYKIDHYAEIMNKGGKNQNE
jgi:DNA-binding transcriptional MerR regulator